MNILIYEPDEILLNQILELCKEKNALYTITDTNRKIPISTVVDTLFKIIENNLAITKSDIRSKNRKRGLADARKLFSFFLRFSVIEIPLKFIAHKVGYKDHTSVIYNLSKVKGLHKTDVNFRAHYTIIQNELLKEGIINHELIL